MGYRVTDIDSFVGQVHLGDCVEVMAQMPANSVDAIVTDPPYGMEFMGKAWDKLDTAHIRRDRTDEMGDPSKRPYLAHSVAYQGGHGAQSFHEAWAREAFRVAKPGAFLVAFGGTRTYHRLAAGIEDAGWEIRDSILWGSWLGGHIYASGFPKSLDVSKAIDRAAGAEREVVGTRVHPTVKNPTEVKSRAYHVETLDSNVNAETWPVTAPSTDDAKKWAGFGTALKPAWEPIVLARKPLIGTVAKNVLRYGTGGLNIDATRIPLSEDEPPYVINTFDDGAKPFGGGAGHSYTSRTVAPKGREGEPSAEKRYTEEGATNFAATPGPRGGDAKGRWPANVILTDPVLDGEAEGVIGGGQRASGVMKAGTQRSSRSVDYGKMPDTANLTDTYGDSGGASRFFLIPKAARSEKEPLFNPEDIETGTSFGPMAGRGQPGLKCRKCGHWKVSGNPCVCPEPDFEQVPFERPPVKNNHPTVKPLDLMVHLVRLVCPPRVPVMVCSACGTSVPALSHGLRKEGQTAVLLSPMSGGVTGTDGDLQALQADLPPTGDQADVLLEAMRGPVIPPSAEARADMRDVSGGISPEADERTILLETMLNQSDSASEAINEGLGSDSKGVHSSLPAGAPDGDADRLSAGASQSDGGQFGADAPANRGGGSPQWEEGRQSSREFAGVVEDRPRPTAETKAEANRVSELPRDAVSLGACTACGGSLIASERRGVVLDCFSGSGTTLKAADLEGRDWIGIEQDSHYARIARARLSGTQQGLGLE